MTEFTDLAFNATQAKAFLLSSKFGSIAGQGNSSQMRDSIRRQAVEIFDWLAQIATESDESVTTKVELKARPPLLGIARYAIEQAGRGLTLEEILLKVIEARPDLEQQKLRATMASMLSRSATFSTARGSRGERLWDLVNEEVEES